MENIQNKRAKLTDPEEFAIIRSIYFEKDLPREEKLDQLELLDRMYSRERNNLISSR